MTKLNELPDELKGEIGSYMEFFELNKLQRLSSAFNDSLNEASGRGNDYDLWKPHFENYFPEKIKGELTYKEAFKVEYGSILNDVTQNGSNLKSKSKVIKNDKVIVLAAVRQNSWALQYADESLKKDKDVVFGAVRQAGGTLQYADESLFNDKEVVLTAVKQVGRALRFVDESLKKDKEVVLAAVKKSGYALQYADESLKKDKDFILGAVKQNGRALKYADESLKKDKEVVLGAVTQNGGALKYASEELKSDPEMQEISKIKDDDIRAARCEVKIKQLKASKNSISDRSYFTMFNPSNADRLPRNSFKAQPDTQCCILL